MKSNDPKWHVENRPFEDKQIRRSCSLLYRDKDAGYLGELIIINDIEATRRSSEFVTKALRGISFLYVLRERGIKLNMVTTYLGALSRSKLHFWSSSHTTRLMSA